jgi:hypothetical protein
LDFVCSAIAKGQTTDSKGQMPAAGLGSGVFAPVILTQWIIHAASGNYAAD